MLTFKPINTPQIVFKNPTWVTFSFTAPLTKVLPFYILTVLSYLYLEQIQIQPDRKENIGNVLKTNPF